MTAAWPAATSSRSESRRPAATRRRVGPRHRAVRAGGRGQPQLSQLLGRPGRAPVRALPKHRSVKGLRIGAVIRGVDVRVKVQWRAGELPRADPHEPEKHRLLVAVLDVRHRRGGHLPAAAGARRLQHREGPEQDRELAPQQTLEHVLLVELLGDDGERARVAGPLAAVALIIEEDVDAGLTRARERVLPVVAEPWVRAPPLWVFMQDTLSPLLLSNQVLIGDLLVILYM